MIVRKALLSYADAAYFVLILWMTFDLSFVLLGPVSTHALRKNLLDEKIKMGFCFAFITSIMHFV